MSDFFSRGDKVVLTANIEELYLINSTHNRDFNSYYCLLIKTCDKYVELHYGKGQSDKRTRDKDIREILSKTQSLEKEQINLCLTSDYCNRHDRWIEDIGDFLWNEKLDISFIRRLKNKLSLRKPFYESDYKYKYKIQIKTLDNKEINIFVQNEEQAKKINNRIEVLIIQQKTLKTHKENKNTTAVSSISSCIDRDCFKRDTFVIRLKDIDHYFVQDFPTEVLSYAIIFRDKTGDVSKCSYVSKLMRNGDFNELLKEITRRKNKKDEMWARANIIPVEDKIRTFAEAPKKVTRKQEKTNMMDSLKKYYKEHEDVLFPLLIVVVLDHFFNGGGLRDRIVKLAQSLLDGVQGKLLPEGQKDGE